MSYKWSVMQDNPLGMWIFGDDPEEDFSGNRNRATLNGPVQRHAPLTSGSDKAVIFDLNSYMSIPFNRGIGTHTHKPFTIEAWVIPGEGNSYIASHSNLNDLLLIRDNHIVFNTELRAKNIITNMMPNGSFKFDLNGWTGISSTITRNTTEQHSGLGCVAIATSLVTGSGIKTHLIEVSPLQNYSFSIWSKGPVGTNVRLEIQYYDEDEVLIDESLIIGEYYVMNNDWLKLGLSGGQSPENAKYIECRVISDDDKTHTFYIDSAMLSNTPDPLDYFDGDFGYGEFLTDYDFSWEYNPEPTEENPSPGYGRSYARKIINLTVEDEIYYNASYHIVGVYTTNYIQLYVNGGFVGAAGLPENSPEIDGFNSAGALNQLISGLGNVTVQSLATYDFALTQDKIVKHYNDGIRTVKTTAVPVLMGGTVIDLDRSIIDISESISFDAESPKNMFKGVLSNVAHDDINGVVTSMLSSDGLSYLAGSCTFGYLLDNNPGIDENFVSEDIAGIIVDWNGSVALQVETRINGGSWVPQANNEQVAGITYPYDVSNKYIEVRVNFPAGSYHELADLSLTILKKLELLRSPKMSVLRSQEVTPGRNFEVIEYLDGAGIKLNNGTITVNPDLSDNPVSFKMLEFWFKSNDPEDEDIYKNINFGDSISNYTFIINGGQSIMPGNNLVHVFRTDEAELEESFTISGKMNIGQIALYQDVLASDDLIKIYNMYTGVPYISLSETKRIVIKRGTGVQRFANDWTITSSA